MTDQEIITNLHKELQGRWEGICDLQRKYCQKLYEENKEGNLATAEALLEIIKDCQDLLENL